MVDEFLDALRRVARRELILELPSGWMAPEDERAQPVVVLPESARGNEHRGREATSEDVTMVLPDDQPGTNAEGQQEEELVGAFGPSSSNHPASGSRIGRLFGRRRRGQPPSPDDAEGALDDRRESG
jgi:hypothetical protein